MRRPGENDPKYVESNEGTSRVKTFLFLLALKPYYQLVNSPHCLTHHPYCTDEENLRRNRRNCVLLCFIERVNDHEFFVCLLNLDTFLRNWTPGEFVYIWKSERVGIMALKVQRTRRLFVSDVFAAPPRPSIMELKQQRTEEMVTKMSLKKWSCAAWNLIALSSSRLVRQMLANFLELNSKGL